MNIVNLQRKRINRMRNRKTASVIVLTGIAALSAWAAAGDHLFASGSLQAESGAVKAVTVDGRPAAQLSGVISTAVSKTGYRTFSFRPAQALDLKNRQLRFKLSCPENGKDIIALYVRCYNRGEDKPALSFVNYRYPLRESADIEVLLQPGRNNASIDWDAKVVTGGSPDQIDRIQFYLGSQVDKTRIDATFRDLAVEPLQDAPAVSTGFSEAAEALPEFFQPKNLTGKGGKFEVVEVDGKPALKLSGVTKAQKNTNYFIGTITLPKSLDLTGRQLKLTAKTPLPKEIVALAIRFYNAEEKKPCWSFMGWGSPFAAGAALPLALFEGREDEPLKFEEAVCSGSKPERVNRIEFWLGSTSAELPLEVVFADFEFAPADAVKTASRWTPSPVYADKPAAVRHPVGSIKAAAIDRAKANIARHDWAKAQLETTQKNAGYWMKFKPEEIAEMIPAEDAWFKCLCPNCDTQPEFAWAGDAVLQPDRRSVKCTKCGMVFPNEKFPENRSYTIKTTHGKEKTIRYHHGKDQIAQGENYGPRYHLSGVVNYVKIRTVTRIYHAALYYALTGDRSYAERVREVLLRFAEVYPGFSPKYRATAYESPRGHFMAGKLCAWKFHDSSMIPALVNAYSLTRDSGLYSDADKLKIENGICREYRHLITAFPPDKDICLNAVPAHMTSAAMCAAVLGDHELMDYVVRGPHGFLRFVEKYYHRDGFWYENTPSYANMANGPMAHLAMALQGYSDAADYRGDDRYDNFDVFRAAPELALVFSGMAPGILPTGMLPATNDSSAESRQSVGQLELAAMMSPDPETKALAAYAAKHYPTGWDAELSLFLRDPEEKSTDVPMPDSLRDRRLFPGVGWAMLRHPESAKDSALLLYYGGYAGGHSHNCTLSYLYCDFGKETISDLGYLSWWHDNRKWMIAPLAHNLVMVDRQPQSNSRYGAPELFAGVGQVAAFRFDAANAYPGLTTRYARMIFNLPLTGGRQYLVDLFEVRGGGNHDWIFHADGEQLTPPDQLIFSDFDAATVGGPNTGSEFLQNGRTAAMPAGSHRFEWRFDDRTRTIMHYLADRAEQLILVEAPGLRTTKTPYLKVKLNIMVARAAGPESNFAAVIETDQGAPQVLSAELLPASAPGRQVKAIKVVTAAGVDLIIAATPGDGVIRLPDYPQFEQTARSAVIRLDRAGSVKYLWLEGTGKVRFADAELAGIPEIRGLITAVDPEKKEFITDWTALPAGFDFKNQYLFAVGKNDGAYRLVSASLKNGRAVFRLDDREVIRLDGGTEFIVNPFREQAF
jgi:hypothetical protein